MRKKFNMSQEEMSEKFRISRNYLSELETGKKIPTGPLLVAIESVLMLDQRRLLAGKGGMLLSPSAASDEINKVTPFYKGRGTH
ncbi:MAG: helix-turn-helix transcriptional regulator, partial [Thermodesulfobacteriota bacterium]